MFEYVFVCLLFSFQHSAFQVRVVQPFGYVGRIDFILGVAGQYAISAAITSMFECAF